MLGGLWHPPFVGGDHKQNRGDGSQTGERVRDEPFMSWYVDKRHVSHPGERCPAEAEVNREAAAVFFHEAVWISAGESS
jgi:hypothetical protein